MRKKAKTHPGWFRPILQSFLSYIFTITTQESIFLAIPKFTLLYLSMMQMHLVTLKLCKIMMSLLTN